MKEDRRGGRRVFERERETTGKRGREMPMAFRNNVKFSVQFGNLRWASILIGPDEQLFFLLGLVGNILG